jgi:hypothetical protein
MSRDVPSGASRVVRWFAAEFLVVVAGVVVALAATSWWDGRQALEREAAYLGQLLADLDQTDLLVTSADEYMRNGDRAAELLVHSFRESPPTSLDSIHSWVDAAFGWKESPRMIVATAQALMATGDLTLIRSDAVRAGIVSYLEVAHEHEARNQSDFEFYRRAIQEILEDFDPSGAAFPTDVEAFLRSRRIYKGAETIEVMRNNERTRRREIEDQTRQLRRLVNEYLAQRR